MAREHLVPVEACKVFKFTLRKRYKVPNVVLAGHSESSSSKVKTGTDVKVPKNPSAITSVSLTGDATVTQM